ncbi:MAG: PLAT/LH2 domain-containing protein [Verrucomicrobiota bacterium]
MKIFIIGPEGSGKTVFMAMFSHYVATQRNDLELTPDNAPSAKYVNSTLGTLKKQEWPRSTVQDGILLLCWSFGKKNGKKHRIELLEYAGQDVRKLLANNSQDENSLRLRQEIDNSDILIYMLDLGGFVDHDDFERSGEDAWLLQQFLVDKIWKLKHRFVVVSKADRFNAMASASKDDLAQLIASILPEGIAIGGLHSLQKIRHHWIASVLTTETIEDNEQVVSIPILPLKSSGFPEFVDESIRFLDRGWIWRWLKGIVDRRCNWFKGLPPIVKQTCLAIIAVLILVTWWKISRSQTHSCIITFKTGTASGAGTDSPITLTIINNLGKKITFQFDGENDFGEGKNSGAFEKGETNRFIRRVWPVETIEKIEVGIQPIGTYPAWQLDSITIFDKDRSDVRIFPGNWLGEDAKNPKHGPWKIEIQPTSVK